MRLPLEKWFVLIDLKGTYFRHLEKGDQGEIKAKRSISQVAASSSNESDLSSDENEDELSEPESIIDYEDVTRS